MKYLRNFLVSAPLLFLSQVCAGQTDFSTAIQASSKSIVVIKSSRTLGSGFLVSPDGKIVTNLHVIEGAGKLSVQLASGEMFDSIAVLAIDRRRDLAIIKVAGFNLPTVNLGDSDALRVGEPVAVVGSPIGLSGTVTTGVVSAIWMMEGSTILQTDAAINPGNSGGPMIRPDGTVVGVVVAKMRGAESLGFVVPINSARGLLASLGTVPLSVLGTASTTGDQVAFQSSEAFPSKWKSNATANTYTLSMDGDFLYGESTSITPTNARTGAYFKFRAQKDGEGWRGSTRIGVSCYIPPRGWQEVTTSLARSPGHLKSRQLVLAALKADTNTQAAPQLLIAIGVHSPAPSGVVLFGFQMNRQAGAE